MGNQHIKNAIISREIEEFYSQDLDDPLGEQKADAKKKAAEEFRQLMMTRFPNRYFILKRITQNTDFWQNCCWERNYVIIIDENYARKLQNCYEISVNVYLIFMSVDQKVFMGYGRVASDVYDTIATYTQVNFLTNFHFF